MLQTGNSGCVTLCYVGTEYEEITPKNRGYFVARYFKSEINKVL